MEIIKIEQDGSLCDPNHEIQTVCPGCGREAILQSIAPSDIYFYFQDGTLEIGLRKCPVHSCSTLVFYTSRASHADPLKFTRTFFPPVRIDFKKDGIPENVLKIFSEAVGCHANGFYTASAIMIRRTIEEICNDKGAQGKDLYKRIEALRETIVIPKDLLDGMHELRLLGGDAAHVELKHFDEVGEAEAEVAIEFTKEIIKAVFQTTGLLQKLRALKS